MKLQAVGQATRILSVLAASFLVVAPTQAQMGGRRSSSPIASSTDQQQTEMHELTEVQTQSGASLPAKEVAAYKAFYSANVEFIDQKIKLGREFLEKYPKSQLTEAVEAGLTNAYYEKEDWTDFYASADNALALKPDDVDVLTEVGWVIPHVYDANDPHADQLLDKAETYEKHAIQVIATMPKPSYLTDAQFAASKKQKSLQVHSALGLVYFRREDFEHSSLELEETMAGNATPDPTDLYVLGVDLENLKKYSQAADAFNKCAQIPGGLAGRCQQGADEASKLLPPK
jgi:tetratricopeptide (TPR) repeat protein